MSDALAARSPHASHRTPARPSHRLAFGRLLLLLLVLGFAFQGSRSIWSTDEGRYTENALQMIDSGNYLVPAYDAQRLNFTKPPMTYWLIAGSVNLFGRNAWAVRTPYALAFIFTALLLCAMGLRLLPERPWLPGLVYALTLGPFIGANVVSTDTFLTLFEALAAWGFVAATFGDGRLPRRRYVDLMWVGFGLAFLTKGPPGLLPLLGMLPFTWRRDGAAGMRRLFTWTGMLLFFALGLGWYLVVIVREPGLLEYFLRFEVYDRIFTNTQNRHPQWYGWLVAYGPVFTFGALPWWGSMLRGLRQVVSRSHWQRWWREAPATLFLLLWLVVPLVVFCLARSRLPAYVLPLFMPLSLMVALSLNDRIDLHRRSQQLLLIAWVLALLVLKGGVAWYAHPHADNLARTRSLDHRVPRADYTGLVFVQNTGSHVDIEEHTPWGMRLYLDKPVHGLAWRKPDAAANLCRLVRQPGALLAVVDRNIASAVIVMLRPCGVQRVTPLGIWRKRELLMVRPAR